MLTCRAQIGKRRNACALAGKRRECVVTIVKFSKLRLLSVLSRFTLNACEGAGVPTSLQRTKA
ncbi:MAG TPA: hypothetical protein PKY59_05590 [Pyrinomonadaceae bacterium]|nr:hypothetical protein [Pyrinomonadaceae bacterium]